MRRRTLFSGITGIILLSLYFNNASWLASRPKGEPQIYAHRGVHQQYVRAGLTNETCTAERILSPTHDFLENTILSTASAFEAGADRVEIDIYPTVDGEWAVFHDYSVDCRTNGTGAIRDHTMAELRKLDIGHGYTADDGKTFPFRGRFVGAMPTLAEVLIDFPTQRFDLHIKGGNEKDAKNLAAYLGNLSEANPERLVAYSRPQFDDTWVQLDTGIPLHGKHRIKKCAKDYLLTGWFGRLPVSCESGIFVPSDLRFLFWGWPDRLQERFDSTPMGVMIVGPVLKKDGSGAIDSVEDLDAVPLHWSGWVYTNKVEIIGPALENRAK